MGTVKATMAKDTVNTNTTKDTMIKDTAITDMTKDTPDLEVTLSRRYLEARVRPLARLGNIPASPTAARPSSGRAQPLPRTRTVCPRIRRRCGRA